MKKQNQQNLIGTAVEEVDKFIAKMEGIKKSVQERPNGISAEDFAKRVINTLDNCKGKMESIRKKASKK